MHTGADENDYRGEPPPELRSVRERGAVPRPAAAPGDARRRRRRRLARCAVLLLLPVSAPLVCRGLDTDGPAPFPQLLAFLPWFLVPGWLALVLALLARRVLVTLWAVAVLVSAGWYSQPYGPDAAPQRDGPATARFRVLTANLQHGDATGALLDILRREHPHVVAVQECDAACATALRSEAVRDAYPHRVVLSDGSAEGSALLSTYPLRSAEPVAGTQAMPGAVADVAGTRVRVQVAHPAPPLLRSVGPWRQELAGLRTYATRHGDGPLLLAGDFNASQDHAAFRDLLGTGLRDVARLQGQSRTPSWPTTLPPLGAQIDHVLVSEEFEARGVTFLHLPGSDHRAVLADMTLY